MQVDFRYGVVFGLFTSVVAITMSIVLSGFIDSNTDALESAAAFVPLLIGIQFSVRAIITYRTRRKQAAARAAAAAAEAASGITRPSMATPQLDDNEGSVPLENGGRDERE